MRRAARVDANQAEIVKALRDAGCSVKDTSAVGGGFPDLVVCAPTYPHRHYLLEVKDGKKPPSERRLTPDQQRFHGEWKGAIYVVTTPAEALDAVGIPPSHGGGR